MQMSGRLYYVDWLRVIAFAILVVYHRSVAGAPVREKSTVPLRYWHARRRRLRGLIAPAPSSISAARFSPPTFSAA
jgi:hypothetical protein